MAFNRRRFVTLGGGSGSFTTLSGLKLYSYLLDLYAIVCVSDSGGSSGILSNEHSILPPGDMLQAMLALTPDHQDVLFDLFSHRFAEGNNGLSNHRVGNIMITAMIQQCQGDIGLALDRFHQLLSLQGHVLPVSDQLTKLYGHRANGERYCGEHAIDEPADGEGDSPIVDLYFDPQPRLYHQIPAIIAEADMIVILPGSIYTSVLPVLMVPGMVDELARAQQQSGATITYVPNLATQYGQTNGWSIIDHVRKVQSALGQAKLDLILLNDAQPSQDAIENYAESGEEYLSLPVHWPSDMPRRVITDLLSSESVKRQQGDLVKRGLIRHDPHKLAAALFTA